MADKRTGCATQLSNSFSDDQKIITTTRFSSNSSSNTSLWSNSSASTIYVKMDADRTIIAASTAMPTNTMATDIKKANLDISSLMSPPDPAPFENFQQSSQTGIPSSTTMPAQTLGVLEARSRMPMSPPVSPQANSGNHIVETVNSSTVKDPILYPRDEVPPSPPQHPLFPTDETVEHRRLVDQHIAHRDATMFRKSSPPQWEEYELALQVKSQVMKMYSRDRRSWMQKERELLVRDMKTNRERWANKRYTAIAPAKSIKAITKPHTAKSIKVATNGLKVDRIVKPAQSRPTVSAARSPRSNITPAKHRRTSTTPEPGRRVVAPNREDRDFHALEDICPPLNSLPNKPNSLKVDWKGAPVDLSADSYAHLLHPDEISLAANLRLDCATYLTSKRRIFLRRRECARVGKEFRKTDAQQACKIDVNKASKLWTAFEKVGWLSGRWMAGHV